MKMYKWMTLGLVLGAIGGWLANLYVQDSATSIRVNWFITNLMTPVGQIFLRTIFMVVVPLVVSALVLGVYELSSSEGVKAIIAKTILWTIVLSSASVFIGIGLVNFFEPGKTFSKNILVSESDTTAINKIQDNAKNSKPISQTLVELIPKNPIDAAARALDGEMLALMVFSVFFGLGLGAVARSQSQELAIVGVLQNIFDSSMWIIQVAMKLAPVAVFALVFSSVAKIGPQILVALLGYVGVVLAGLIIHVIFIYGPALKFSAGVSPINFFRTVQEVLLTAFSTASSNATLPYSLEVAENQLKIPSRISRFVLTIGATANQNGTALFEGVTVLFLAQVYNIDLSLNQQIQVVLMSILAGIGTAGVPGGSLPLIVILLQSVGIPAEGIGIILGVDRILDMCRTSINVLGDLVIATLVTGSKNLRL